MKTNTKRITHYIMALVSIVVLVLLDQITKHLVVLHLKDRSAYVLIKEICFSIKIAGKQVCSLWCAAKSTYILLYQCTFDYNCCYLVLPQSTYRT